MDAPPLCANLANVRRRSCGRTASPAAAAVHECVAGPPTAASYTWDFKGEANTIFQEVRSDARQALEHAGELQSFTRNPALSSQAHDEELLALKEDVNQMGSKLCRLETIWRVVAPWQQKEIDRIAVAVRLMADNTQDAILYANAHPEALWMPTYVKYANNLVKEAQSLANSTRDAVAYNSASKEYQTLRHEMAGGRLR